MSINHLTNPDINPKLDIYCKNLNSIGDADIGVIKDLKFKAVDESVIHASSLINRGDPGQVLTSSGDGSLYWSTGGGGGSGIEYTGTQPVLLNSLSKYNSFDASTVSKTTFTDTDILLKNGSVQMTGSLNLAGNSIDNNLVLNTAVLAANISESPIITVNDTLDMTNSSIVNCFRVTTDSLQAKTVGGNITILSNLEMKNDDILNCSLGEIATLDTSIIKNTNSPDIVFPDNSIQMNQNDISDINLLNDVTTAVINTVITASITSSSTDILVGKNLNLENNEITNVTKINGITPVGGLYSGISDGVLINQASLQTDLLPVSSVGSLFIPADGFKTGDAYHLVVAGTFPDEVKNDTVEIEIRQNGTIIGTVLLTYEDFDTSPSNFELEADFVIRSVGITGSLSTNIDFTFNKKITKDFKGTRSTSVTTIDTTTDSSLSVLATVTGAGSSIQSSLAYLRKQY